ncbi:MAG: hypothetical protein Q4A41_04420, partial [Bacillota bacterium]|nr:hypothetical protein [Bacillota bacterium]
VSVYDIRFGGYEQGDFRFDITCSKGTYVRTICADLGKALHVPAHMKDLVRTESGGFRLSDAIPLEDVSPASILSMDYAVKKIYNMSRVILPRKEEILHRLENGIRFDVRTRAVSIETSNRNGEVSVERDVQKIRQWNSCDGKNGFLYVEDRFYGILNSNFELDRLIKDK